MLDADGRTCIGRISVVWCVRSDQHHMTMKHCNSNIWVQGRLYLTDTIKSKTMQLNLYFRQCLAYLVSIPVILSTSLYIVELGV